MRKYRHGGIGAGGAPAARAVDIDAIAKILEDAVEGSVIDETDEIVVKNLFAGRRMASLAIQPLHARSDYHSCKMGGGFNELLTAASW